MRMRLQGVMTVVMPRGRSGPTGSAQEQPRAGPWICAWNCLCQHTLKVRGVEEHGKGALWFSEKVFRQETALS